MHDVVAHAVSSMVVQAGAAEQLVDEDPTQVRTSLAAIRRTGSDALAEMRRMVVVLRDADGTEGLSPQPGLAALATLVESTNQGDLAVSLEVQGRELVLPAGLDLAVFRIVQEALTNARRHAGATRVDVTLRYLEDMVVAEVRDDGVGCAALTSAGASGGHGLVGMRERASLYGGRVEVGAADGSGFTVRAVLPVATS
jgi:signal transduction histidine kinase